MRFFITTVSIITLSLVSPAIAGVTGCGNSSLEAQKRCKKGCPCGNSCISCSKTCRVGTGSATSAPTKRSVASEAKKADSEKVTIWVASRKNKLYFRSTCPIAGLVEIADRMTMTDSTIMITNNFKRLDLKGC